MTCSEAEIIRQLQACIDALDIEIVAKESVAHLREVETCRERVEKFRWMRNYASLGLDDAKRRLDAAEKRSRGE